MTVTRCKSGWIIRLATIATRLICIVSTNIPGFGAEPQSKTNNRRRRIIKVEGRWDPVF